MCVREGITEEERKEIGREWGVCVFVFVCVCVCVCVFLGGGGGGGGERKERKFSEHTGAAGDQIVTFFVLLASHFFSYYFDIYMIENHLLYFCSAHWDMCDSFFYFSIITKFLRWVFQKLSQDKLQGSADSENTKRRHVYVTYQLLPDTRQSCLSFIYIYIWLSDLLFIVSMVSFII